MSRSLSPDVVKAAAIFGVVFIHSSTMLGCGSSVSEVFTQLFRFGVGSFILIWAYFFERAWSKRSKPERKKYLQEKLFHLIQVYLIWSVLYFLLTADWATLTPVGVLTRHFMGYGWAGQYFFIILIQLMLLYPLLRWIYDRQLFRYVALGLLAMVYYLWSYHFAELPGFLTKIGRLPFFFWVPYLFAGVALSRWRGRKLSFLFGGLLLLIPLEYLWLDRLNLPHLEYIIVSIPVATIALGFAFLTNKINFKNERVTAATHFVGSNTMTVFVANPLFIITYGYFFPRNLFHCSSIVGNVLIPFIAVFSVLAMCLLLVRIIEKTGLKGIVN